jgi:PAT family beta-lactamase induction signal transducer AmpG
VSLNKKLIIISILYFAEGLPFGILEQTLPVYFRIHGMSLTDMGLLTLVSLPYALKFLWAPAVDFLGTRRHWITAAQYVLAACMIMLVTLDPSAPSALLWVTLGSLAVVSATQDIAIDAYSIEMLRASEMGIANGFRQAAYRVAMVVAGGLFVALGGWMGWQITFVAAGVILAICALISLKLPPIEVRRPRVTPATLVAPLLDLLMRPGVVYVAAFILLYKLGDMAIGPMVRPFWLAGELTTTQIGLITGTFGILSAILGGLAGGLFMARFGIFHGLWFLGLWQSLSNLSYAFVAAYPETGKTGIYVASVVESFCGGLGTAAFLAFLMSICRKEFSATQYALLSALFRVTGIIAGAFSGWATARMGYADFFALTFLLSLPAFLFIFKARRWIPINNGASHTPEQITGPRQPDLVEVGKPGDGTRLSDVSKPLRDRHPRYPDRRRYGSQQAYQ